MATASDIITRALKLVRAVPAGETPSDEEMTDALDALNDMLHSWALKGIDVGHTTLGLTDTVTLPDAYLKAVRYNLAVELAPEYGVPLAPEIVHQATIELSRLHIDQHSVEEVDFDRTLTALVAHGDRYSILTDD